MAINRTVTFNDSEGNNQVVTFRMLKQKAVRSLIEVGEAIRVAPTDQERDLRPFYEWLKENTESCDLVDGDGKHFYHVGQIEDFENFCAGFGIGLMAAVNAKLDALEPPKASLSTP